MRSVTDDARAEVERNDERQGVLRVARERAPLVRRESVADVARQPERPDRGRVAEERREALPERARVCATMHEPRDGVPADVSAQDFEDGDQGGRDAGEGAILPQEPAREAEEPEEEERPDEPRAMRGRRRGSGSCVGRGAANEARNRGRGFSMPTEKSEEPDDPGESPDQSALAGAVPVLRGPIPGGTLRRDDLGEPART